MSAAGGATFGSAHTFGSNTGSTDLAALSDTTFVVAYESSGSGMAEIGDVSGTTISFGSTQSLPSGGNEISAAALSSSKFVVAYETSGGPNEGVAAVGNVSMGNSINFGTQYAFNSSGGSQGTSVAALSGAGFVVAYHDGAANESKASVGTVSGSTTISFDAGAVFESSGMNESSVVGLSAETFAVVYPDSDNMNYATAVAGTRECPYIGIAEGSAVGPSTVSVLLGGISNYHSGLTTRQVYYVDAEGDVTTTAANNFGLGIALSPNLLFVDIERW